MDNCNICDGNSVISECKTCLIKCCKGCFERHKGSCNILKDAKYHQCQEHGQLVKAFCCHCYQLICKDCVVDNHVNHNYISLLVAYRNREDIVKEFIGKQQPVNSYIDACKETRQKYCLLEAQIEEEEKYFQRCIGSVRESLLQQVEPNIKQIEDQCRAGEEILKLQEIPLEDARQNCLLVYLARLSRYRNGLNAFEKQYMSCSILVDHQIAQSRENVHQVFLSKVEETVYTCDKVNAHSYEAIDNKMDIDIVPGVHTLTIQNMPVVTVDGHSQQWLGSNNSDGNVMKNLEEMSTKFREHESERAYILEFLKSFPKTVDNIEHMTEASSTAIHLPRHDNVVMVRFSEEMEHVFNSMMKIKNQLIKTEQDLKNKISSIANWTNDQRQSEKKEIRIHQGILDEKNKELEILQKGQAIRDDKIKKLEILNHDLQQRLQGKTNLKKLETECNLLKQEKTQLQNQRQDAEQYHKLCKENKDLQEELRTAQEIIYESYKKVTDLENEVFGLKVTVEKKEHDIKALIEEKDDYLTRLSSITGDTGNQAIPALCDPNRPMKITERFGELYDNEWTNVIGRTDEVKALYPDMKTAEIEVVIIRHLYQLLMCCYRECLALSKEQLLNVGKMVLDALKLNTKGHGRNMFGCKEVSNIRRQGAAEYADYLFQHKMITLILPLTTLGLVNSLSAAVLLSSGTRLSFITNKMVLVDKIVLSDWQYVHKSNELVGLLTKTPFFEKCIHICWHMATKDPVMHLDEELTPDTVYDKSVYREFVKSGDKVTFVVWPALFLHEGGPLLNKGVVQAY